MGVSERHQFDCDVPGNDLSSYHGDSELSDFLLHREVNLDGIHRFNDPTLSIDQIIKAGLA